MERGGSLFSNDAGTLLVEDFTVDNVTAVSVFATSSGGVSMLGRSTVTMSDVETVTFTNAGSTQTVRNVDVTRMVAVNDIFSVLGQGSRLIMNDANITQNNIEAATGVRVVEFASATIENSDFSFNTGVSFGFVSRLQSNMELIDVELVNNTGLAGEGQLTALTYTDDFSNMTLRHLRMRDNFVFTAHIFALYDARAEVYMTCIESGGGDAAVFISESSSYLDVDNYISPDFSSTTCGDPVQGRLSLEDPGSGCFNPDNDNECLITCTQFGTLSECTATMSPTATPTMTPTQTPSTVVPDSGPIGAATLSPTVATGITSAPSTSLEGSDTGSPTIETALDETASPTASPAPTTSFYLPPNYSKTFSPTLYPVISPTMQTYKPMGKSKSKGKSVGKSRKSGKSGKSGKSDKGGKSGKSQKSGKSRYSYSYAYMYQHQQQLIHSQRTVKQERQPEIPFIIKEKQSDVQAQEQQFVQPQPEAIQRQYVQESPQEGKKTLATEDQEKPFLHQLQYNSNSMTTRARPDNVDAEAHSAIATEDEVSASSAATKNGQQDQVKPQNSGMEEPPTHGTTTPETLNPPHHFKKRAKRGFRRHPRRDLGGGIREEIEQIKKRGIQK